MNYCTAQLLCNIKALYIYFTHFGKLLQIPCQLNLCYLMLIRLDPLPCMFLKIPCLPEKVRDTPEARWFLTRRETRKEFLIWTKFTTKWYASQLDYFLVLAKQFHLIALQYKSVISYAEEVNVVYFTLRGFHNLRKHPVNQTEWSFSFNSLLTLPLYSLFNVEGGLSCCQQYAAGSDISILENIK